jgi:sterol desaturase/sphingolipid hydroxylase (fatty acid hydroxylase superfamily)
MNELSFETVRAGASLLLLVLLLTWESFAPFFSFFAHAGMERARHGLRNLGLGAINAALNAVLCVSLWWTVARWAEAHSFGLLNHLGWTGWMRLAGAFLLVDLWMYCWHRLNHRLPFLWRFHRMHHSDSRMDVTTANRFHLAEILLSCVLRVPVIALAGVRLGELAVYEAVMFSVVQLHHANVTLTAPADRALRLLIVTPFMHKVHHSNWRPETDSNYSSLFSFWDRLFGSLRLRDDPRSLVFGLHEFTDARHHTLKGLLATPFGNVARSDAGGAQSSPPPSDLPVSRFQSPTNKLPNERKQQQ